MFENIVHFFKKFRKSEKEESKSTAKERLHLVLAQDRANISADFLEMMKQEILEVIKKYIDIDEKAIDVRLTNKESEDGSIGAPALYANIPIITIKNEARKLEGSLEKRNKSEEKTDSQDGDVQVAENEIQEDTMNNATQDETPKTQEANSKRKNKPEQEENVKQKNTGAQDIHMKKDDDNVDEVENEEEDS